MIIKKFAAVVYLSENMDCGLVFDSLLTTDRKGKSQTYVHHMDKEERKENTSLLTIYKGVEQKHAITFKWQIQSPQQTC